MPIDDLRSGAPSEISIPLIPSLGNFDIHPRGWLLVVLVLVLVIMVVTVAAIAVSVFLSAWTLPSPPPPQRMLSMQIRLDVVGRSFNESHLPGSDFIELLGFIQEGYHDAFSLASIANDGGSFFVEVRIF